MGCSGGGLCWSDKEYRKLGGWSKVDGSLGGSVVRKGSASDADVIDKEPLALQMP